MSVMSRENRKKKFVEKAVCEGNEMCCTIDIDIYMSQYIILFLYQVKNRFQ